MGESGIDPSDNDLLRVVKVIEMAQAESRCLSAYCKSSYGHEILLLPQHALICDIVVFLRRTEKEEFERVLLENVLGFPALDAWEPL